VHPSLTSIDRFAIATALQKQDFPLDLVDMAAQSGVYIGIEPGSSRKAGALMVLDDHQTIQAQGARRSGRRAGFRGGRGQRRRSRERPGAGRRIGRRNA